MAVPQPRNAAERQGKDGVSAVEVVETQAKGGVFALKAVSAKAAEAHGEGNRFSRGTAIC